MPVGDLARLDTGAHQPHDLGVAFATFVLVHSGITSFRRTLALTGSLPIFGTLFSIGSLACLRRATPYRIACLLAAR